MVMLLLLMMMMCRSEPLHCCWRWCSSGSCRTWMLMMMSPWNAAGEGSSVVGIRCCELEHSTACSQGCLPSLAALDTPVYRRILTSTVHESLGADALTLHHGFVRVLRGSHHGVAADALVVSSSRCSWPPCNGAPGGLASYPSDARCRGSLPRSGAHLCTL